MPATIAVSVPWPRPVCAKEPYRVTEAAFTLPPARRLATCPMRTAPAVWELEGPIIRGPIISNTLMLIHTSSLHSITQPQRKEQPHSAFFNRQAKYAAMQEKLKKKDRRSEKKSA